jgi:ribonuclease HI
VTSTPLRDRTTAMKDAIPHYLLFSEVGGQETPGQWRFIVRTAGSLDQSEVCDIEPDVPRERLELMVVVLALESLDHPSRVTIMTPGSYVRHGIRHGLSEWRVNGWQWEYFGQMVPIKHADLWQRLDRALQFHQVEFCKYRMDAAHQSVSPPNSSPRGTPHTRVRRQTWRRFWSKMTGDARRGVRWLTRWWRRNHQRPQITPSVAFGQVG